LPYCHHQEIDHFGVNQEFRLLKFSIQIDVVKERIFIFLTFLFSFISLQNQTTIKSIKRTETLKYNKTEFKESTN